MGFPPTSALLNKEFEHRLGPLEWTLPPASTTEDNQTPPFIHAMSNSSWFAESSPSQYQLYIRGERSTIKYSNDLYTGRDNTVVDQVGMARSDFTVKPKMGFVAPGRVFQRVDIIEDPFKK